MDLKSKKKGTVAYVAHGVCSLFSTELKKKKRTIPFKYCSFLRFENLLNPESCCVIFYLCCDLDNNAFEELKEI